MMGRRGQIFFFSRGDPQCLPLDIQVYNFLHNQVNTKPSGKETPKVSKELFNFDSLEVIGAQHAHTPSDHVCTPVTKWKLKLLECPCIPELIGKVHIKQMVGHLKFVATRFYTADIQPKMARQENSGKNFSGKLWIPYEIHQSR